MSKIKGSGDGQRRRRACARSNQGKRAAPRVRSDPGDSAPSAEAVPVPLCVIDRLWSFIAAVTSAETALICCSRPTTRYWYERIFRCCSRKLKLQLLKYKDLYFSLEQQFLRNMRLCNCEPLRPTTSRECTSVFPGVAVAFDDECDDWSWNVETLPPFTKLSGPDNRTVLFHEMWSFGTAGMQGEKRLTRETIAYWEIFVSHRVFGTALMFGIGTKQTDLYATDFREMIGGERNAHSFGLSHKGLLYHNGVSVNFCDAFEEFKPAKIGLLFDGPAGTLRFSKDDQDLGIGFSEIFKCHDGPFYPMVSSTAAKTEMTLGRRLKLKNTRRLRNLSDLAAISVVDNLSSRAAIEELPLPAASKITLKRKWDDLELPIDNITINTKRRYEMRLKAKLRESL